MRTFPRFLRIGEPGCFGALPLCRRASAAGRYELLRHQRRFRQGRGSGRPGRRRRALPDAGGSRRRGRKDVARLSQHQRRRRGERARPHRRRAPGSTPRASRSPPISTSCTATPTRSTRRPPSTRSGNVVKGRGDDPNQHDILTGTQRDGTAFAGRRGPHLQQLDLERRRRRHGRPPRPHRQPAGHQLLELLAPEPRLQPGSAHRHRRQRLFLLLRQQLRRERTLPSRGKPGRQLQKSRGARGDSLARSSCSPGAAAPGGLHSRRAHPISRTENRTPS